MKAGRWQTHAAALAWPVRMEIFFAFLFFALARASGAGLGAGESGATVDDAGWTQAVPGWKFEFPRDHGSHRDFKTEWWYFTGNLRDAKSGREFGYELTFFRQGIRPAARETASPDTRSRFAVDDFKFAHFAISDLNGKRFHFDSKINRGAFAEAGFGDPTSADQPLAWIDGWNLTVLADGSWRIAAHNAKTAIDLTLRPAKPPIVHGENGVSQKADGTGNASHYYSFTRLLSSGQITLEGSSLEVSGTSWFDHEWASNQLGKDQVGWDWFCLQFDDGSQLMLYTLRRRDGSIDANSSGTLVDANGHTVHLKRADFTVRPLRHWKSERTGGHYPIEWEITIPARELVVRIQPRLDDQELALGVINYWEGAVSTTGTRAGRPVQGAGYLELTGYAEELGVLK